MTTLPVQVNRYRPNPASGFNYMEARNNSPVFDIGRLERTLLPTSIRVNGELVQDTVNNPPQPRRQIAKMPVNSDFSPDGYILGYKDMLAIRGSLAQFQYA